VKFEFMKDLNLFPKVLKIKSVFFRDYKLMHSQTFSSCAFIFEEFTGNELVIAVELTRWNDPGIEALLLFSGSFSRERSIVRASCLYAQKVRAGRHFSAASVSEEFSGLKILLVESVFVWTSASPQRGIFSFTYYKLAVRLQTSWVYLRRAGGGLQRAVFF